MAAESHPASPYAATHAAPGRARCRRATPSSTALQRAWDDGDAVLPLDPRLPPPARAAVLRRGARSTSPWSRATPWWWPPAARPAIPSWPSSPTTRSRRRRAPPAPGSPSIPTADRWLACLPLAHVGGLAVVTRALLTGTPCTVHERFDADAVAAGRRGGLHAHVARAHGAGIGSTPAGSASSCVGGQAPPADRPAHVIATYGMTETGSGVVYDGGPLDGVEVRIDADGEIHVRGPMLLRAYRDGRDPKDAEGWFADRRPRRGATTAGSRCTVAAAT